MKLLKMLCLVGFATTMVGCAGSKPAMYTPVKVEQSSPMPDWVMKGSAAFPNEPKTVFFGVGISNSMPNISLLREAADSRARANVASEMKTVVAKLTRDYMDMHVDYFNQDAAGSDEFISYVSKLTTDETLLNCRVNDRWQDTKTGALYSLARMDSNDEFYKNYKENLKKAISDKHLAVVTAKRDEAEKTLDAEIEKQRANENKILGK